MTATTTTTDRDRRICLKATEGHDAIDLTTRPLLSERNAKVAEALETWGYRAAEAVADVMLAYETKSILATTWSHVYGLVLGSDDLPGGKTWTEALEEVVTYATRQVITQAQRGGRSSSATTNLARQAETAAYAQFLEQAENAAR